MKKITIKSKVCINCICIHECKQLTRESIFICGQDGKTVEPNNPACKEFVRVLNK